MSVARACDWWMAFPRVETRARKKSSRIDDRRARGERVRSAARGKKADSSRLVAPRRRRRSRGRTRARSRATPLVDIAPPAAVGRTTRARRTRRGRRATPCSPARTARRRRRGARPPGRSTARGGGRAASDAARRARARASTAAAAAASEEGGGGRGKRARRDEGVAGVRGGVPPAAAAASRRRLGFLARSEEVRGTASGTVGLLLFRSKLSSRPRLRLRRAHGGSLALGTSRRSPWP